MLYLGIDPGQSGGIAVLTLEHVLTTWKMPETEHDISNVFASSTSVRNQAAKPVMVP